MDLNRLAEEVHLRRRKLGWSQEELARLADISRNYVSLIERGEAQNVSLNVVRQLALAFGTSTSALLAEGPAAHTLIPPALREFGLEEGLSFDTVDRLAHIPRRGQEPASAEEWRALYEAIKPYLD